MKYELLENIAPGCGTELVITAENVGDSVAVAKHFKGVFGIGGAIESAEDARTLAARLVRTADGIEHGNLVHTATATQKRPWFAANSYTGPNGIKPYADLLKKLTGFDGVIPEQELTQAQMAWHGLMHTYITESVKFSSDGITTTGFITSEDWNGKSAEVRAEENFSDYVCETFGFRKSEPEYIDRGSTMVKNPNYLRRHNAEPGLGSNELWTALFTWWRENVANDAQRAALDESDATAAKTRLDPCWALRFGGNPQGYVAYQGLTLSYSPEHRALTWGEFAALQPTEAAACSQ